MILTLSNRLINYFVAFPSIWVCLMLWHDWNKLVQVWHSYHRNSVEPVLSYQGVNEVDIAYYWEWLDHLVKVVSAILTLEQIL